MLKQRRKINSSEHQQHIEKNRRILQELNKIISKQSNFI